MSRKPNSRRQKKKVMIALSGGVDSAVSAVLLLQAGFLVEAAFMKNWSSTQGLLKNECPWLDDRREALKVAAHLGIPLHTFDFEKEYQDKVMKYFFEEYAAGRTPNPDVMCNKEIKFKLLYEKAMQLGFDYLATGHYAQVKKKTEYRRQKREDRIQNTEYRLVRSVDEFKDQTYFIYNLKPEQLAHVLFPIGGYKKSQVRVMARKMGLPNAERKESMGLCFVGKIRLDAFLKQKIAPKTGKIVDMGGNTIGTHHGAAFYTLGQRQGLGLGGSGPYYLVSKDLRTNTLVVTKNSNEKQLFTSDIQLSAVNWLIDDHEFPMKCKGRFRHQQELQDLTITRLSDNLFGVHFADPQRAVASGQSLVLYNGKICLGGGAIV